MYTVAVVILVAIIAFLIYRLLKQKVPKPKKSVKSHVANKMMTTIFWISIACLVIGIILFSLGFGTGMGGLQVSSTLFSLGIPLIIIGIVLIIFLSLYPFLHSYKEEQRNE